jgi:hypothetical protein
VLENSCRTTASISRYAAMEGVGAQGQGLLWEPTAQVPWSHYKKRYISARALVTPQSLLASELEDLWAQVL